jgi:hypothetical protein
LHADVLPTGDRLRRPTNLRDTDDQRHGARVWRHEVDKDNENDHGNEKHAQAAAHLARPFKHEGAPAA